VVGRLFFKSDIFHNKMSLKHLALTGLAAAGIGLGLVYGRADAANPPCYNYGDVDRDGSVTSVDASLVLQHDAGLLYLNSTDRRWADVNDDREADSADALSILHYAAGNLDNFPACGIIATPVSSPVPTPGQIPQPTTHEYMNIDVAVMHYGIGDEDLERVKKGLDLGREFFWRNTGLKLNLNFIAL
jgi:hypothetical protein